MKSTNAIIIVIGTEILFNNITESNSVFIKDELLKFNIMPKKVIQIGDNYKTIVSEIKHAIDRCDYLFILGGLGATEDDLTRTAVAEAFGRKLVFQDEDLHAIETKLQLRGVGLIESLKKQAFFPEGSIKLKNDIGLASGFHLLSKRCSVFVMPGVPSEAKSIFYDSIVPILKEKKPVLSESQKLVIKTYGIGESILEEQLKKSSLDLNRYQWGTIASLEGVKLQFIIPDDLDFSAEKNRIKETLKPLLGKKLYGYDDDSLLQLVSDELTAKELTLSTAESCTGGLIAKTLTDRPGSSAFYIGSVISYSNELKMNVLNVRKETLKKHGAVSEETAKEMALGCKNLTGSDYSLAVTGIAGPDGGTDEKPIGTVYFGLANPQGNVVIQHKVFSGTRDDVRIKSMNFALNLLREMLYD